MNRIIRKIKSNQGGIAVNTAIMLPALLLIVFMIMDLLYIANQRNDIQRRADSATLAMVALAKVDDEKYDTRYYQDPDGNLIICSLSPSGIEGEYETLTENGKYYCYIKKTEEGETVSPCEITKEYYDAGISQLKKDLSAENYNTEYFDETYSNYDNLSSEYKSSLKSGIVELRFPGKVYGLFSKFGGIDWSYEVLIESQAVCYINR